MVRGGFRVVLCWTVFAAAAGVLGCQGISLQSDHFACDPGDPGSCPEGWFCRMSGAAGEYRCFEGEDPPDAGGTDAEPTDAGPTDAGPADAAPNDAAPSDAAPNDAEVVDGGGDGSVQCGPGNCAGCCDSGGQCQTGNLDGECGQGGALCLDCAAGGEFCAAAGSCIPCDPGSTACSGETVMFCNESTGQMEQQQVCDPSAGTTCQGGACVLLCDLAAAAGSNLGCEFLALDVANTSGLGTANDDCFAVLVANAQQVGTAMVTVEDAAGQVLNFPGFGTTRSIAPGSSAALVITGDPGDCSGSPARANSNTSQSGLQPGTAFRVLSTLPVVAYQVNPYDLTGAPASVESSVLLPVSSLGTQYYYIGYPGLDGMASYWPAQINIVAAESNTTVTVTPVGTLLAGGPVPVSGQFTTTLQGTQHLQILASTSNDLTGSIVTADKPIAVFGGALCANVPVGVQFCDHLEEQLPPVAAWGWTHVAALPPQRGTEDVVWRVLAAVDNTNVVFSPASVHASVNLSAGGFVEVAADESFLVTSDPAHPILVAAYLKGRVGAEQDSGVTSGFFGTRGGDPAMALSVPVEQYRTEYVFVADPSFLWNYLVVARTDPAAAVHLDCFDPIPGTHYTTVPGGYDVALVTLSTEFGTGVDGTCAVGAHRIWSTAPFGIWLYGLFDNGGYGYPGGMNTSPINSVVLP
ncbi:MAG: IgGFc-binding protein [bacterium]